MMKSIMKTGLLAFGAVGSLGLIGAPVTHAMSASPTYANDVRVYEADLNQLNGSGASGRAIILAHGSDAIISIQSAGLSADLPHAQHLHFGAAGTCPSPSADKNGDGLVSVAEAQPNYGPIKVSLTTTGDYSAASGLAVDRFPVATDNGTVSYTREVTLPEGITADNLGNGVIVQHGISSLFNDPAKYDGSTPSSIDPTLPIEATIPADCGALKDITPAAMTDNGSTGTFDMNLTNALSQLHNELGTNETVTAQFAASYASAKATFEQTLMNASERYTSSAMTNQAVARDQYIDTFNNAKSTYFGQLEAARNSVVDQLSGTNDVAKDHFVNAYNSARDSYGNQLEMMKNQF